MPSSALTSEQCTSIQQQFTDALVEQAKLQQQLKFIVSEVSGLSKVLMEGNGQPSVLNSMAVVEGEVKSLRELLKKEITEINKRLEGKEQYNRQWKIAVYASIVALVGSNLFQLIRALL